MQEHFPSARGDAAGLGWAELFCRWKTQLCRPVSLTLRCHLGCPLWGPGAGMAAGPRRGEWRSGRRPPPSVAGQPVTVIGNGPAVSPAEGADKRTLTWRVTQGNGHAAGCHRREWTVTCSVGGGG